MYHNNGFRKVHQHMGIVRVHILSEEKGRNRLRGKKSSLPNDTFRPFNIKGLKFAWTLRYSPFHTQAKEFALPMNNRP